MSDETQKVAPEAVDNSVGTSDEGQSSQSVSVNQPNDPELMRADYTRKTMELAEQRRAFEAERQEFERMRMQSQSYQQPQHAQQAAPTQDYTRQGYDSLVAQFGVDGANAILQRDQLTQQKIDQIRFESAYAQEELKGKFKYGEEAWNKHTYFDNQTGQTRNRVMDYRMMINPITGRAMTLDEAWKFANPVDPEKIAQEVKQKTYQEMQAKTQAVPAKQPNSPGASSAPKRAMTVSEAFRMALNENG